MAVALDQLEPGIRQTLGEGALRGGGDLALVAAEHQRWSLETGQQRQGIDGFEAIVHGGRDIGPGAVHLGDDPVLQFRVGVIEVEAITEGLPAPGADPIGAHRLAAAGFCRVHKSA
jgi:hypothetical protein